MINLFKKTYKILETNTNGEIYYWVKYGSFFNYQYLDIHGAFWENAENWGGKFTPLEIAKEAIKKHAYNLFDKRLNKTTTKTIQYI